MNKDGVPKQFVLPLENLDCGYNDLSSLENDREAIALEHCKRELKVPFDLRKELPIRFEIIKLNETRHWLLIVVHHIVFDGWSMDIFLQSSQPFIVRIPKTLYLSWKIAQFNIRIMPIGKGKPGINQHSSVNLITGKRNSPIFRKDLF